MSQVGTTNSIVDAATQSFVYGVTGAGEFDATQTQ
jgi:hypothetical protein